MEETNTIALSPQPLPKHVAINITGKALKNILEIVQTSFALKLPILTFYTHDETDDLLNFLTALIHWDYIERQQVKVSVIGKWYDLPERLIEPIKEIIESTKDYDAHFLNLCLKYDGQEELVDACKLIAKQVQMGKLAPEGITKATLKENIYTSYFIPPDLIIIPGEKKTSGVLLWDSPSSVIHFAPEQPDKYDKNAFMRSLQFFQRP